MRQVILTPVSALLLLLLCTGCPEKPGEETTSETQSPRETTGKKAIPQRNDDWLKLQRQFEPDAQKGINFIALGNEPFWNVKMDMDRLLTFEAMDKDSFQTRTPEGMRPADLNAIIYRAADAGGSLTVTAYRDSCFDNMSGTGFPYKVLIDRTSATGERTSFQGCGVYLTSPILNDIWSLASWTSKNGERQSMREKSPRLEFNFQTNTLYGFDGDCEITGKFEPMGDRIRIYQLAYVDEECRPEVRSKLFDQLNITTHNLTMENRMLRLSANGEVLEFAKAD